MARARALEPFTHGSHGMVGSVMVEAVINGWSQMTHYVCADAYNVQPSLVQTVSPFAAASSVRA